MGCFSPDAPAPVNYGAQTRDTLQAQVDLAPQLYDAEAKYQPLYADLALQNLQTLLQGNGTTPGMLSAMSTAQTSQRASDIADVQNLGLSAHDATLSANPESAALLAKLNAQANAGLDAGAGLTPEEQRAMQQASRAAFAARGLSGSNAATGEELLAQYNLGQQLMRQRQSFAQTVLGNNQAVIGDPFMQILGRSGGAVPMAQNVGQTAGPSLFNPESPLAGQIAAGNQAYAALFAEPSTMAKIGQVGNTVGGIMGSFVGGMCWAAREVFGAEDPRWRLFRNWLLTEAPAKLRNWYALNGAAWAARLRERPAARAIVKRWMQRRIEVAP